MKKSVGRSWLPSIVTTSPKRCSNKTKISKKPYPFPAAPSRFSRACVRRVCNQRRKRWRRLRQRGARSERFPATAQMQGKYHFERRPTRPLPKPRPVGSGSKTQLCRDRSVIALRRHRTKACSGRTISMFLMQGFSPAAVRAGRWCPLFYAYSTESVLW